MSVPELPEVETTVRGLRPVLEGRRIAALEARRADLRRALPVDLRQRLTGARVVGLRRRAKYGLIDTDREDTLLFHLGMSGHWRIDPAELGAHDHLVIDTEADDSGGGRRVALNDARRFGSIDLARTDEVDALPGLAGLGPEPLGDAFTGAYLARKADGRTASIKALLMDQRIVAGLGNIYVLEALHRAGIAPARRAGYIARARLDRLADEVRAVLEEGIASGGATVRSFAAPDGSIGHFPQRVRVYGKEGEPCACGGVVKRRVEGGRSSFWCPACQR